MAYNHGTNVYYCYLIGWSKFDICYYGSRVANTLEPEEDLWKVYFTSSKRVKDKRKTLGEPDVIQIRKIFYCKNKCRTWETKVIKRLNLVLKSNWLNQTDNTDKFYHEGKRGCFSEEHKKKLSEAAKNRKQHPRLGLTHTEESKQKMKQNHRSKKGFVSPMKGKKASEETKLKQSLAKLGTPAWNKGKTLTDSHKEKIRVASLKQFSNPIQLAIKKQKSKELWQNPDYREKTIAAQKRARSK